MYEQLETLGVMAELKGLEYPAGVIKGGVGYHPVKPVP